MPRAIRGGMQLWAIAVRPNPNQATSSRHSKSLPTGITATMTTCASIPHHRLLFLRRRLRSHRTDRLSLLVELLAGRKRGQPHFAPYVFDKKLSGLGHHPTPNWIICEVGHGPVLDSCGVPAFAEMLERSYETLPRTVMSAIQGLLYCGCA